MLYDYLFQLNDIHLVVKLELRVSARFNVQIRLLVRPSVWTLNATFTKPVKLN